VAQEPERRIKVREPIKLKVRFRTLSGAISVEGNGETVNFSSHGILVEAPLHQRPRVGSRLEAVVEWPIRLNGTTLLELTALGTVQRAGTDGFAIKFEKHKLRSPKSHR
jgi:hypothetical protein